VQILEKLLPLTADGGAAEEAHASARLLAHSARSSPKPWRRYWNTGIVIARAPYERGCLPFWSPARSGEGHHGEPASGCVRRRMRSACRAWVLPT